VCCEATYLAVDGTHCGSYKYGIDVLEIIKDKKDAADAYTWLVLVWVLLVGDYLMVCRPTCEI
jgi:hypothetical protein